jgi:hypothetical protein
LISFSLQIPKVRVRIGEWDFSTTGESHAHIERKITQKVVHPKYNFFTYENDLALIRLEKKVQFQPNIIPICLPGNDDLLIGKLAADFKAVRFCSEKLWIIFSVIFDFRLSIFQINYLIDELLS